MSTQKIARVTFWIAGLLFAACSGTAADPDPATTQHEQAIRRIACAAPADCSARGGDCRGGVCRADNECATATDCATGQSCVADVHFGGLCGDGDESAAPMPSIRCSSAGTCPAGQVCQADGTCKPAHKCHSSSDCPHGQICNPATNRCIYPPTPTPSCNIDADCPTGEICDATTGKCVTAPVPCIPRPDGTCCDPRSTTCPAKPCNIDSDCPTPWVCRQPDPASPRWVCVPK